MSWYDNLTDTGAWGRGISNAFGIGDADPTNPDRGALRGVGQAGMGYAGQAQGNYGQNTQALNGSYNQMGQTQGYLQGVVNGQGPAAGQLQQGLTQNLAAQRSMAASQPGSAQAARTAGANMASMQTGLAGQQQLAGLQERNQAAGMLNQSQQNMGNVQLNARGQDASGANAAYGNAANGYNSAVQNPMKTGGSMLGGAIGGIAGGVASLFSDKNLKTNIKSADDDAKQTLGKLNAYRFDYRDQKHGAGNQLGILAQELEKAGLGHVIEEKPEGKAVNTGRLSLANTAMMSSLHKRLTQLEESRSMRLDPQTGEWINDDLSSPPPVDDLASPAFVPSDQGPPIAAAGPAADSPAMPALPTAAAAPAMSPPIDNSIQGAPHPFEAPDHWFGGPPANDGAPAAHDDALAHEPDAISGGASLHDQYNANIAGPPTTEALQTADQHAAAVAGNKAYSLDDREKALDDSTLTPTQKAQVMAQMSPEDLAALNLKHEQEKIHWQAQQQLDASRHAQEDAAANLKLYQDAQQRALADSAQREADAKKLAAQPIGHHIGIGEAIARVVLGAIGGAASQFTGGKNLALEQFQKNVDEDVANQKAELENQWKGLDSRKGAIADELARHGDMYRAAETVRLSAYDRALGDIQTKAQDYDPAGTTAMKMADAHAQISAMRSKTAQSAFETNLKNQLDIGKARLEAIKADHERDTLQETERHNKAGEGLDWSKLSLEKSKTTAAAKSEQQVFTADELQSLHPGMPVPPVGMSLKDYGGWLERGGKGAELKNKELVSSGDERARTLGVGDIVDTKGNTVLFRNEAAADKVASSKAALDTGAGLIDRLIATRKKYGWSSNLTKSDEWRQMNADFNELVLQKKNIDQLGAISETDMNLVGGALGTKDPTEVRDPIAGLKAARVNMVNGFNAKITTAIPPGGAKPKRYEPPSLADIPESKPLVGGKTAVEKAAGAPLGIAGQALSFTSNDERALKAENQGDATPTGLSGADDAQVLSTIHQAAKGNADAIQRLVDASSSDRAAVTSAVLGRIEAESPEVYAKVIAKIPPEVGEQRAKYHEGIPHLGATR